jgi:FlaA1/EpsC-like NDP-sugar epimerase
MGSVSSRELVRQILSKHGVTLVLHAAAYKHVGLVEKNVGPGIENNVFGTEILLEEVIKASSVLKFVLVSSDKAVRPTNVMGATKRLAELLVMRAAKVHPSKQFGIVRFGNVIGSSGSVVPKFLHQIKTGRDVTVSHRDVIRFFMTPNEASDLILLCSLISKHGEVYLLDMGGPIKIFDLAKQLVNSCGRRVSNSTDIRSTKIVFSGLGIGEKMYEELLINDGSRHGNYARIFLGNEDQIDWGSFDVNYRKLKSTEKGYSGWSLDERDLKLLLQRLVTEYQVAC